jgi:hypothetical protein
LLTVVWKADESPILLFIAPNRAHCFRGAVLVKSVGTRERQAVTVTPVLTAATLGRSPPCKSWQQAKQTVFFHADAAPAEYLLQPTGTKSYMQTTATWKVFLLHVAEKAKAARDGYNRTLSEEQAPCDRVVFIVDMAPTHNSQELLQRLATAEDAAIVRDTLCLVRVPPKCTECLQPLHLIFTVLLSMRCAT